MILPTHIVAAGGIVINDKNQFLLVKNSRKVWEFPGGIVEPGETVPQGLIREIKEETGADIEIINISGMYSNTEKKKGYNSSEEIPTILTFDFICKYISGNLQTSDDSMEVAWFSEKEVYKNLNERQQLRFKQALNHKEAFCCLGYKLNSSEELEIHEEYVFDR